MKIQKLAGIASVVLAFSGPIAAFPAMAFAGDEATAYQEAKEKNRAHVGIHQRREAYREYLANVDSVPAATLNQTAPAAGEEKKPAASGEVPALSPEPLGANDKN